MLCNTLTAAPILTRKSRRFAGPLEYSFTDMSRVTAAPPNFSWVEPQKLAGMACPSEAGHYRFLLENGIRHLVCLCESKPPNHDTCPSLTLHHISVADYTPPAPAQILRFLRIVEEAAANGQGVGVHCMYGQGRTGTMLACYLVKTRNISGLEAIKEVRRLRQGSIETEDQEKAVIKFQQHLQNSLCANSNSTPPTFPNKSK